MSTSATTKVLVLHHDPLVYAGLTATLREQPDFALLPRGAPAFSAAGYVTPAGASPYADVVVADYEHGLALVAKAHGELRPRVGRMPQVLIVTQRDSESEIRHALELGVRGYLVSGCGLEELLDGVRAVHRGMRHIGAIAAQRLADSIACSSLTSRETDVLRLVAVGQGNKAIARQLDIAIGTVKSHLKAIFEKLDAKSRTEVAAVAERRGLLAFHSLGMDGAVFAQHAPRGIAGRAPSIFDSAVH